MPPFDFKQIKTAAVRKVARSFRKRTQRVHNMIEFPAYLVGLSGKYTEATFRLAAAMAIQGGKDIPDNWGAAQRGMFLQTSQPGFEVWFRRIRVWQPRETLIKAKFGKARFSQSVHAVFCHLIEGTSCMTPRLDLSLKALGMLRGGF